MGAGGAHFGLQESQAGSLCQGWTPQLRGGPLGPSPDLRHPHPHTHATHPISEEASEHTQAGYAVRQAPGG